MAQSTSDTNTWAPLFELTQRCSRHSQKPLKEPAGLRWKETREERQYKNIWRKILMWSCFYKNTPVQQSKDIIVNNDAAAQNMHVLIFYQVLLPMFNKK